MEENTKLAVGLVCCLLAVTLLGASVYGYINNIVLLVEHAALGGKEVVRALGILLPPLGAIMGYI